MLDYLIRRLGGTIPVLLAVSAFVFLFVHLLPGDPARLVAGPDATPQDIAAVRADMGLDRPLIVQFLRYLGQTVQLQFGRSIKTHQTVAELIGERFMPTLLLTVFAMLWSVIFGIGIGVLSGVKRGRWQDQVVDGPGDLRHLVSELLAWAAADRFILRPARLAADRRRRELAELRAALVHAGHRRRRGHGALHAIVIRRDRRRGFRAHRARQGRAGASSWCGSTRCATR